MTIETSYNDATLYHNGETLQQRMKRCVMSSQSTHIEDKSCPDHSRDWPNKFVPNLKSPHDEQLHKGFDFD